MLINKQELKNKLLSALKKFYRKDPTGLDYAGVEIEENEEVLVVSVWAEEGYNGLEKLCDLLNPIIQKYDSDSYFEPECPGRISAWLRTARRVRDDWGLKNTKSIKDEESNNKLYVFKGVSYVDPNDPNDYYIFDEEFNVIAESKDQAIIKLLNKLGNYKNRSLSIDFTTIYDSSDIYKKFNIIV